MVANESEALKIYTTRQIQGPFSQV